jgi:hypothetical protein
MNEKNNQPQGASLAIDFGHFHRFSLFSENLPDTPCDSVPEIARFRQLPGSHHNG